MAMIDFNSDVYNKYFRKIYNYIQRSVLNKEIAEDLTSSVFLKALKFITKKKPVIENMNAWIYKIASNELITYYKRNKIVSINNEPPEYFQNLVDADHNSLDRYDEFLDVKRAVEQLKPKDRVLIEMHYFENLSYQEMAEILNLKVNHLRVKVHRILKIVRQLLENNKKS